MLITLQAYVFLPRVCITRQSPLRAATSPKMAPTAADRDRLFNPSETKLTLRRAWSRDDGEIGTVFYFGKCLTRSRVVCRSVTEVTTDSDRGILLLALIFPWTLRFISEGPADYS